jgi:hypothetical protein
MAKTQQLTRVAARRLTRRLSRSIPWVGSAVALLTLGAAIRRKGMIGGAADTALDFVPFVGAAKNLLEVRRGRDFIPERQVRRQGSLRSAHAPL